MTEPLSLPRPSSEGPPVPLLVEGMIDAQLLEQLFADLQVHAQVFSIQEKNDPRRYSTADRPSLDTVQERLLSGQARAVQLRYRYDGSEWADTLLAVSSGFRVIRCKLSQAGTSCENATLPMRSFHMNDTIPEQIAEQM